MARASVPSQWSMLTLEGELGMSVWGGECEVKEIGSDIMLLPLFAILYLSLLSICSHPSSLSSDWLRQVVMQFPPDALDVVRTPSGVDEKHFVPLSGNEFFVAFVAVLSDKGEWS